MAIHPTAIISEDAELAPGVEVGPYAVIDGRVTVGSGTRIYPHAFITGRTVIGRENRIFPGAVVGAEPQDVHFEPCESGVRIGDRNVIREGAQVHRGARPGSETVVGDGCYLMANSHVAHNCRLADDVILANCALLAGFVTVGDRAFLSGGAVIHQFVRIGTHAFVSGNASVSMDVPPYLTVRGRNAVCRVNRVGLKRSPVVSEEAAAGIERAYRVLYRSGLTFGEGIARLAAGSPTPEVRTLIEFFESSERGVCRPERRRGRRPAGGE